MPMGCTYNNKDFTYTGPNGREGRCHLLVYQEIGRLPLVVAVALAGNSGAFITNAATEIANSVWGTQLAAPREGLLLNPREGLRLVEVRRQRNSTDEEFYEEFYEVIFTPAGQTLDPGDWQPTTRAQVEEIIGQSLILPAIKS